MTDLDLSKLSLFQRIALLPAEEQEGFLGELSEKELDHLPFDGDVVLRPGQMPPMDKKWHVCLLSAGRGFGKTFAGSHWVKKMAKENPGCRIALVGRTFSDVMKVMINGPSGIMSVHHPDERPEIQLSKGRLLWANGSQAEWFTSESPSQLRGPSVHFCWADEFAAWDASVDDSGMTCWDNVRIAAREGDSPRILATTTPKRCKPVIDLFEESEEEPEHVTILRGSTYDNISNLSEAYLAPITGKYENTEIGRQELLGELLGSDSDGLWTKEMIDTHRYIGDDAENLWRKLPLRCVGLDPNVSNQPGSDEAGIVVAGSTGQRELHKRHAYVIADRTVSGGPEVWAQVAVDVAREYRCPIVAEKNQGGELVRSVIHGIDPGVKVHLVWASRGKFSRAEPLIAPYTQGRVHHVGYHDELELQQTTFSQSQKGVKKSPDRLDASVWALTALLVKPPEGFGGSSIRISSAAPSRGAGVGTGRGTGRTWRNGLGK